MHSVARGDPSETLDVGTDCQARDDAKILLTHPIRAHASAQARPSAATMNEALHIAMHIRQFPQQLGLAFFRHASVKQNETGKLGQTSEKQESGVCDFRTAED
jgi:hypothetical protein